MKVQTPCLEALTGCLWGYHHFLHLTLAPAPQLAVAPALSHSFSFAQVAGSGFCEGQQRRVVQYPAFVCASTSVSWAGRVKELWSTGGAALQLCHSLWALEFGAEGLSRSQACCCCYCSCLSQTSYRAGPRGSYSPARAPALPDDNNLLEGPTASSRLWRAARPGRDLLTGGGFARTKTSHSGPDARQCQGPAACQTPSRWLPCLSHMALSSW